MEINQFTELKLGVGKLSLGIVISLAVLFGACSAEQENRHTLTTSQKISESDQITMPTYEFGPTPTPIPTIPPTPTVVPFPTLGFENSAEAVAYLFETNNLCEFPCWWGIIPGETEWLAAREFLRPFTVEAEQQEYLWYLEDGDTEHRIVLEIPKDLDSDGLGSITIVEDWWGIVRSISINTKFSALGLDLKNFLEKYGTPGEVYIYSIGSNANFLGGGSLFTIGLFYEDDGILMAYFGISEELVGEGGRVEICSSELVDEFAWLELWDPKKEYGFEKVSTPGLNAGGELEFRRIGDVSGLSAEDFYDQLIEGANRDFCFDVVNPGDV